jgi:hypothetical protein
VRLPWPFSHSAPDGDRAEGGGSPGTPAPGDATFGAPNATVGAPDASAVPLAAPTGAWAALPPIQRTVGRAPVVAPAEPFLARVPGHLPLPPIVQPLGHDTGPGAPVGLVVARPEPPARPIASLTSSAPMPTRAVQRNAGSPVSGASAASAGGLDAAWTEVATDATEAGSVAPGAGQPAVRSLATVTPAATVVPPARPLTQAPASPLPVGRGVQRHAARDGAGGPASGRPIADDASPAPRSPAGLPQPATINRWAEATSAGSADPGAAASSPGAAASLPVGPGSATAPATAGSGASAPGTGPRPAVAGGARRPGLGAPISVPPASAVAQRLPMRQAPRPAPVVASGPLQRQGPTGDRRAPASEGTRPALARPDHTSAPGEGHRVASGRARRARAAEHGTLPVLPVARTPRPGQPAPPEPPAAGAGGASPAEAADHGDDALPRAAFTTPGRSASAKPTVAPLLGARPLRPVVAPAVQREPSQAGGQPPVAARWIADDQLPATVSGSPRARTTAQPVGPGVVAAIEIGGRSGSTGGELDATAPDPGAVREIVFPPRDGLPPGSGPAADVASGGARVAAPGVQRTMRLATPPDRDAPDRPALDGPHRVAGPAAAPRSSSALEPGAAPLMLARPALAAQGAVTRSDQPVGGTVVAQPAAPVVQTSPAGSTPPPATLPAIVATPIVQRVEGAAPTPDEDTGGHSDSELDELARALFGRIRTHLRAEVIHEREARGLTFDAF